MMLAPPCMPSEGGATMRSCSAGFIHAPAKGVDNDAAGGWQQPVPSTAACRKRGFCLKFLEWKFPG